MRGYKVFVDAKRGNCASCHYHGAGLGRQLGMFTDYSYEAIGVPATARWRPTWTPSASISGCAGRRAPTTSPAGEPTRSAGCSRPPPCATSPPGRCSFTTASSHSLEQAVRFYATRDTRPELWYPTVGGRGKAHPDPSFPTYGLVATQYTGGTVQKYDDLPAAHRGNIDGQMPLDGRARGAKPPLGEHDVQDLILLPRDAHRWIPPARDLAGRRALRELR